MQHAYSLHLTWTYWNHWYANNVVTHIYVSGWRMEFLEQLGFLYDHMWFRNYCTYTSM